MGNSTANRLVSVLFLTGALPVLACESSQELRVSLYDEARADRRVLKGAKKEAAWLLRSACVEVDWTDCVAAGASPCGRQTGDLEMHILAGPITEGSSENALGLAIPARSRAAVFYSRIRETALTNRTIDVPKLLGCAMAHELGHLLLRSNEHASDGVMRTNFGPAELKRASQRQLTFTIGHRLRIHESAIGFNRLASANRLHAYRSGESLP